MTYGEMVRKVLHIARKMDSNELYGVITMYRVALRTYAEDGDAYSRGKLRDAEIELADAYKENQR